MKTRARHRLLLLMLFVCAWSGLSGRAQIQDLAAPDSRGAISGVVLDASSKRPLQGVVVTLSMEIVVPKAPTVRGTSRQVTDASGRFVFTTLPAAAYTIAATRLGYFDGGYGRASQRAGNRRLALADGQWLQDATIRLWRHTSIGGTVLDEANEPVTGTWVRVLAQVLVSGRAQWVSGPVTRTDDRGMYRFGGLTPGKWVVMVPSVQTAVPAETSIYTISGTTAEAVAQIEASGRSRPLRNAPAVALSDRHRLLLGTAPTPPPAAGGRPQVYPITFHPSARALNDAVTIDTSYGEDRGGVDVALRPLPAFSVSGVVEGPPEEVDGLILRLMADGTEGPGTGSETATTLAERGGAFTFLSVPAGSYSIVATRSVAFYSYDPNPGAGERMQPPPGLAGGSSMGAVQSGPPDLWFHTQNQPGAATSAGRASVEVGKADLTGVVVRMERGVSISGRVVTEIVKGEPVPNLMPVMNVSAVPADGDPALGQPGASLKRTDEALPFTIDGLQRGEYLIRTIGGGFLKSVVHEGADYTDQPFDTSGGQNISGVVVTMTYQSAQLTGTVRDANGLPVTGDAVALYFPAQREQWSRYGRRPLRLGSTTVGNDGSVRFPQLPAGDYLVIALDDEHAESWKDPAFLQKVASSATRVTLGWGETKTQSLTLVTVR